MTELKPCPCCEGKAKYFIDTMVYGSPDHIVYCTNCGLRVTGYNSKKEAIEAWNTRPDSWHTGTPTEEGWYLIKYKVGKNGERTCYRTEEYKLTSYCTFKNMEWQKIEETSK